MARRAGKATSRKARQRNVPRPPRTATPAASPEPRAIPPVGTPDALEAASLTPPRRMTPAIASSGRSQLSTADRAEYHYVERDLRSIGILSAAMAALLLVAWFAFSSLGLV